MQNAAWLARRKELVMRARHIPIRDKNGIVVANAIVDAIDYLRLCRYRWHFGGRNGHVARWDVNHKRVWMHHEVMSTRQRLDHENRNPLDNRRSNLRVVSTAENAQNQDSRGGSSRHRGVVWDKTRNKWRAQAVLNGRCHNLGRFSNEEEAAVAASRFRAKHMPFSEDALMRERELVAA